MTDKRKPEPLTLVRKDGSVSESHGPATGKVRPPFEKANTAALVHGASSERAIAAKAEEVHRALIEFAPWLDEPHYAPTLARYLAAAGRERLLDDHIQKVCAEKGAGAIPVRLWESVTSVSRLAHKLADDLGLTPMGHSRIAVLAGAAIEAGATVADLAARGAALREQAATRVVADAIESTAKEQS